MTSNVIEVDVQNVLTLLHSWCLENNLCQTARALEQESEQFGLTSTSIAADVASCGPDLLFVRNLVLDAQWDDLEDLCSPLSLNSTSDFFDASLVLFTLRRQQFLELYHSRFTAAASAIAIQPDDVNILISVLRKAESVAPSRAAFNSLAYVLTLPGGVTSHPDFSGWSPHVGRLASWKSIRPNFERVFPSPLLPEKISSTSTTTSSSSSSTPKHHQLETLISLAAGATIVSRMASDPRLLVSPSSLPRKVKFNPLFPHNLHLDVPGGVLPTEASSQMNHASHLHGAIGGRGGSSSNSGNSSHTSSLGVMISSGAHATALSEAAVRLASLAPAKLLISGNNGQGQEMKGRLGGSGISTTQSQVFAQTLNSVNPSFGVRGGGAHRTLNNDGGNAVLASSLIMASNKNSAPVLSQSFAGPIKASLQQHHHHHHHHQQLRRMSDVNDVISSAQNDVNLLHNPDDMDVRLSTRDLDEDASSNKNSLSSSSSVFAFPPLGVSRVVNTSQMMLKEGGGGGTDAYDGKAAAVSTDADFEERLRARFNSSSSKSMTSSITTTSRQLPSTNALFNRDTPPSPSRSISAVDPAQLPPAGLPSRSPSRSHSRGGRRINPSFETSFEQDNFDNNNNNEVKDNDEDFIKSSLSGVGGGAQSRPKRGSRWDAAVPPVRSALPVNESNFIANNAYEGLDENENDDRKGSSRNHHTLSSSSSFNSSSLPLPPPAWNDETAEIHGGARSKGHSSFVVAPPPPPPPPSSLSMGTSIPPVNPHAILLAGTANGARASLHASAIIGEIPVLLSTSSSTSLHRGRSSMEQDLSSALSAPKTAEGMRSHYNHPHSSSHSLDNHINIVAAPSPVRANSSVLSSSNKIHDSTTSSAARMSTILAVDGVDRPLRVPHPSDEVPIVSDELSPWKPYHLQQQQQQQQQQQHQSSFSQSQHNKSSINNNSVRQSQPTSGLDTSLIDALRTSNAVSSSTTSIVPPNMLSESHVKSSARGSGGGVGGHAIHSSSTTSLPIWMSDALVNSSYSSSSSMSNAEILSSAAAGFLPFGTNLAGNLTPIAALHDTQPIRTVVIDPLAPSYSSSSTSNSAGLVAIGTNSKALKLAKLPSASGGRAQGAAAGSSNSSQVSGSGASSGVGLVPRFAESVVGGNGEGLTGTNGGGRAHSFLPELDVVRTWSSHHGGSVYCLSWTHADPACEDALVVTGSNDTFVKVTRFNRDGEGGSGVVTLSPEKGTVRDVCWLGGYLRPTSSSSSSNDNESGSSSSSGNVYLACAGSSGGYGICVWDASVLSSTTRSPFVTLQGHSNTVHAIKPFNFDNSSSSSYNNNNMLVSASADGTVRLWDIRSPTQPAMTLFLSTSSGALANVSDKLSTTSHHGSSPVEIHALCTRTNDVAIGCADGTIAIVDVKNGRIIAKERVHDGEIRSVDALGPLLLSSGFDCSIVMSSVIASSSSSSSSISNQGVSEQQSEEARIKIMLARKDHTDKTLNARFHPHQAQAVTSSADKSVLVWDVSL